ncbi:uncharacterized protein si:ch211-221j21.3 [Micropterus salmoides]|uniref:uncharacterized protein si:ch211-221j21.3 n=1 Tax=Micropterus salmoides TaxID=27706 RepID=UPI0018ECD12B|nr:uncharacterized protein si:ch211-221j21.3 [Micropterus salmoides]
MQCANLLKKRSLETEVEPWSCIPKRLCLEAELRSDECPMETSHSVPVSDHQPEQQVAAVRPRAALLCCPRCLAGEPGHINHIMGL